ILLCLALGLACGTRTLPASDPTQAETDAFYAALNRAEAESKKFIRNAPASRQTLSKESLDFLQAYLAHPEPFLDATARARAALALFRFDPNSIQAQDALIALMRFVRESDDDRPDYLGIFAGIRAMGARAKPICAKFSLAEIP